MVSESKSIITLWTVSESFVNECGTLSFSSKRIKPLESESMSSVAELGSDTACGALDSFVALFSRG